MIAMAFTNYSKVDSHLVLFDWVGLENFRQMFDVSGTLGKTFWSVLGWTIVWAVFATGLNYILGMLLALLRRGSERAHLLTQRTLHEVKRGLGLPVLF